MTRRRKKHRPKRVLCMGIVLGVNERPILDGRLRWTPFVGQSGALFKV